MYLKSLSLQNFRNYENSEFNFSKDTTFIVGPNTAGKTNIIEAIYLLSNGKSFRGEKDAQMVRFGEELGRIKANLGNLPAGPLRRIEASRQETMEVVLTTGEVGSKKTPFKKFLINGVSKRRLDFVGNFYTVLFSPLDLEIIIGSPSLRRNLMDTVLEQADLDYRIAISEYEKGLRQRNSLLDLTRKTGERDLKQFDYWDNVLIKNGQVITAKREAFIAFVNSERKEIFDFAVVYDRSTISYERLLQYQQEELYAGVTLVGPHRDDINFQMYDNERQTTHNIKLFGSRGQQRLTILQLKLLELSFVEKGKKERPTLLLDDIFSELDESHIKHVIDMVSKQQTIITTTHKEFIPSKIIKEAEVIDLPRRQGGT